MDIWYKEHKVTTLNQWRDLVFIGQKRKHWKEGRSAFALADFIFNKNGIQQIKGILSVAIGDEFELLKAHPEYEVRFDKLGHGREHDLAIWGLTKSQKKIFIGIESKVDETFGDTIGTAYIKAKTKEINGEKTNAPKRIERLLELAFSRIKESDFDLRYQLLFSTAGTLCIDAHIHIFLILVFKTQGYNEQIGKSNKADLQTFLRRINAEENPHNYYKVNLQNKELKIIYKEIDIK